MITLGENIRNARHNAGLSQTVLARRLEVAEKSVRRWESGECDPSLATLRRIAKTLEVNIETLVREEEQ